MEKIQYAFVGCSSSDKIDDFYKNTAKRLSMALSQNNFNLVFGACDSGLMGEVYRTMKQKNSHIIGVAPTLYRDDFKSIDCDEEYCVDSTSERINLTINKSDIICFLAGGTGTLEEIIVAIELKRRKEIDKPIIIYDENNFYYSLVQQLSEIERQGFSNSSTKLFEYINDQETLNNFLKNLNNSESMRKINTRL